MKQIFISFLVIVVVAGCGVSDPKRSNIAVDPATAVKINNSIPFTKGVPIAANIRNDCTLQKQLSEFIVAYAVGEGIGVLRANSVSKKSNGKVLHVEITNAVSGGNAFIGHRKYVTIKGALYNSGKKQAGFTAARVSSGGMFAGFKSSCSVLGRTVKALGSDISQWLKNPADGVHLGDHV